MILTSIILNLDILNILDLPPTSQVILLFAAIGMFILTLDFIGYFKQPSSSVEVVNKKTTTNKNKELNVPLLNLVSFKERMRYQPFEKVDNGYYLELTEKNEITYHVIDVQNEQLPDVLQENNQFVSIDENEKKQLDLSTQNVYDILSFPPGSYQEAGYYVEIDNDQQIVDNIKYIDRRLPPTTTKGHRWIRIATQKTLYNGNLELTMELPSIFIKDLEDRKRYKSLDQAINGYYLEITSDEHSTDRVVNVSGGALPKILFKDNQYIEVNEEESHKIRDKQIDVSPFKKYTPGSYTTPGYYIEVDIHNQLIDNIKYTERRLPPTSDKGHRWIHFLPRKIVS
jgi:hypothetical protein